jgi:hypothetical protein
MVHNVVLLSLIEKEFDIAANGCARSWRGNGFDPFIYAVRLTGH